MSTNIAEIEPENTGLDREALTDVIDLALWSGQLLLQYGADSRRIEETVHHIGTSLGCDWLDVFVTYNTIIVTTSSDEEFRTKVRRVPRIGVDMTIISAINRLSRRVANDELDRAQVRSELVRITTTPPHYNRWLVVFMVGLACASLSQLFGGNIPILLTTFFATSVGMVIRQELTRRHFNYLLVIIASAFVTGLVASVAVWLHVDVHPEVALSASVLFLIPGAQLINAVADLTEGHMVIGIARGVVGALISLAIAIGLLLAMSIAGVNRL